MSEVPIADQVPPAPVEVSMLAKMLAKGKKLKLPKARIKARTKIKARGRPQTPLSLSPSKLLIQGLPRHKLRILVFVVYLFFLCLLFLYHLFVKEMYHTFAINEDMFLLLQKS